MLWGSPLLSRRQALSNRPAQAISAAWICTSLSVRESTVQSAGVVTTEYPVRSLTNAPYSQAQRSALHGRTAQGQTSHMPLDLCDDEFPTAATACRAMAYQEGERREEDGEPDYARTHRGNGATIRRSRREARSCASQAFCALRLAGEQVVVIFQQLQAADHRCA